MNTYSPSAIRHRFPALAAARAADAHKGSCGTLAVIGGSSGMSGAVVLAATAALKSGCGKVFAGFHQDTLPLPWLPEAPEIMLRTAGALLAQTDADAWVIGCGLGTDAAAARLLETALYSARFAATPLLLDADALTLLASMDEPLPQHHLRILTPHPGEAARLLHCTIADIQNQREASAQAIAARYHAWTVLKGPASIIAAPDGTMTVNDSGNPALASAGSGDVLAGIIGSLFAQRLPTAQAVAGGVWLHGAAADELAAQGIAIGLCASELANAARKIRNHLTQTD